MKHENTDSDADRIILPRTKAQFTKIALLQYRTVFNCALSTLLSMCIVYIYFIHSLKIASALGKNGGGKRIPRSKRTYPGTLTYKLLNNFKL